VCGVFAGCVFTVAGLSVMAKAMWTEEQHREPFDQGVDIAALHPLACVVTHLVFFAAPFSVDLIEWLSRAAAEGLASRPTNAARGAPAPLTAANGSCGFSEGTFASTHGNGRADSGCSSDEEPTGALVVVRDTPAIVRSPTYGGPRRSRYDPTGRSVPTRSANERDA